VQWLTTSRIRTVAHHGIVLLQQLTNIGGMEPHAASGWKN
jgi:hypothetical protein